MGAEADRGRTVPAVGRLPLPPVAPPRPTVPPRPTAPPPPPGPPAAPSVLGPVYDGGGIAGPPTVRLRPVTDEDGSRRNPLVLRPGPRTAVAAACLVLGVGLLGGAAAGSLLGDDAAGAAAVVRFDHARELWHTLPVDSLFPRTLTGENAGPGGADRKWIRVGVAPDSGCKDAFDPLLAKALSPAGCARLVRGHLRRRDLDQRDDRGHRLHPGRPPGHERPAQALRARAPGHASRHDAPHLRRPGHRGRRLLRRAARELERPGPHRRPGRRLLGDRLRRRAPRQRSAVRSRGGPQGTEVHRRAGRPRR